MVGLSAGKFRCIIQTPTGSLFDCRTGLVVVPAHDGMRGILRNHIPMLLSLSMGIVEVKDVADRNNAFFLVNGGFARISENNLVILTDDVETFEGMDKKQIEERIAKAKSLVVGGAYITTQTGEEANIEKARLVTKMARLAALDPERS